MHIDAALADVSVTGITGVTAEQLEAEALSGSTIKLLATAQIEGVYFELGYESRDDRRDAFWKEMVQQGGFKVFEQLSITPETINYILPNLRQVTSRRRLPATAAPAAVWEPHPVGALEQD